MKFNHIGIPTAGSFDGEIPLPHLKMTVSDHQSNPLAFEHQPQAGELAELLAAGTYTVAQIALRRRETAGVPPTETLAVLDRLFLGGFFDEEPPAPPVPESPVPEATGLLQLTATGRSAE